MRVVLPLLPLQLVNKEESFRIMEEAGDGRLKSLIEKKVKINILN